MIASFLDLTGSCENCVSSSERIVIVPNADGKHNLLCSIKTRRKSMPNREMVPCFCKKRLHLHIHNRKWRFAACFCPEKAIYWVRETAGMRRDGRSMWDVRGVPDVRDIRTVWDTGVLSEEEKL